MSNYSSMLRDPRWQRKRLKILERDKWKCTQCGESKQELNVHHLNYKQGSKPWNYKNEELITLCVDCHNLIHKETPEEHTRRFNPLLIIKGVHLLKSDLPSFDCGFSIHKNILVMWDVDLDTRVLLMIDDLDKNTQDNLVFIYEHKGGVFLIWKDYVPDYLSEQSNGVEVNSVEGGDCWTIYESKAFSSYFENITDFSNSSILPLKDILVWEGGKYELR